MARVKVVLRDDVEKVGEAGDVVTVAGGFARNFLIPRGMAVPATKGNVKQAEAWRRGRAVRAEREESEAAELKARLEAGPVSVAAQAGPDGQLFGSVTAARIAEALETAGAPVDRRDIDLPDPIRSVGMHEVTVSLHPQVKATLTIEVVAG